MLESTTRPNVRQPQRLRGARRLAMLAPAVAALAAPAGGMSAEDTGRSLGFKK
jgi:hypothetical protein